MSHVTLLSILVIVNRFWFVQSAGLFASSKQHRLSLHGALRNNATQKQWVVSDSVVFLQPLADPNFEKISLLLEPKVAEVAREVKQQGDLNNPLRAGFLQDLEIFLQGKPSKG